MAPVLMSFSSILYNFKYYYIFLALLEEKLSIEIMRENTQKCNKNRKLQGRKLNIGKNFQIV